MTNTEITTEPSISSITFLNWSGDVTITWDSQNKDAIVKLVEDKMKQGYSFFIVKPRVLSFLGNKKVKLTCVEDLRAAKGLVVPDATAAEFLKSVQDTDVADALAAGTVVPAKAPHAVEHATVRRAKAASEVLANQSIAVRPVTGG